MGAYLLGVPAWVIILVGKHNWIAASIEAGGVPAMLFGLFTVIQHKPILTAHQLVSLGFVAYGFVTAVKATGRRRSEPQG